MMDHVGTVSDHAILAILYQSGPCGHVSLTLEHPRCQPSISVCSWPYQPPSDQRSRSQKPNPPMTLEVVLHEQPQPQPRRHDDAQRERQDQRPRRAVHSSFS